MKPSMFTSLWWVIKTQYKTAKLAFVWRVGFSFYDGLLSIVVTYASAQIISNVSKAVLDDGSTQAVYFWLVVIVLIEVIATIMRSLDRLINTRADQKLELVANERFFNKLYELSQEQFDDEEFNTSVSRAQDGIMRLWRVMAELTWGLTALIKFIVSILAVLFASPVVGILILITIIPSVYLRTKQNKINEDAQKKADPYDRIGYRTRWVIMDPEHMPEVRTLNGLSQLVKIWRSQTKKSNDITFDADRHSIKFMLVSDVLQPFVEFIANVIFFRLLLAGTLGLDRFIFLRGILDQATGSALSLASSFEQLHELSIDLQNFDTFIHTAPAIPNGTQTIHRPLTIEFKDVSFSYPVRNEEALKNVSFVIHPGSKLALVGENGAGKSTLIKLLLRQYLPSSGQILVNGIDMKDVEQESYYKALSILSQEFLTVHHLTIKDNLTLGVDREVSEQELIRATDLVDATDYIQKLPNKFLQRLDTSFKDGSNLSGGQIQRLGVARALLRGGDIMILDEPTSAIDAKAEYKIFNNIYEAHEGKTTLIVSHRFSTVRKADRVIVMEQGKIIEYGSHEELMSYGGLYKEMFDLQAEGYK